MAIGNRGMAYLQIGDHDRAIADYNRAIELNPQFAMGASTIAATLTLQRKTTTVR